MEKVYNFLKSEKGRKIILSGWTASGITEALQQKFVKYFVRGKKIFCTRDKSLLNILYEGQKFVKYFVRGQKFFFSSKKGQKFVKYFVRGTKNLLNILYEGQKFLNILYEGQKFVKYFVRGTKVC